MAWKKISEAPEDGTIIIGVVCRIIRGQIYQCCGDGSLVPLPPRTKEPEHFYPADEAFRETGQAL